MQTWRLLLPLCLFCLPAINCQLRVERNKISSVFWEYHAWSRNTGRKLSSNDYQRELPVSETEASELMCSTLSQLPSDADLVAISGTSFHPALNRFCQLARIACVYTDSQVGRHMPTDWQYNAINFFPAPELRSRSIYEFVKWSEWTEFAVLYTGFHDLERMHTLLPFPNGHVMFRMINLDFPSLTFRLLTQLKLTTMHRFLLALPQTLVPKFLNLASAANLTSMAYNFLLVGGMNRTYFREHVASRLYSGVNFTSHQFDGVSFIDDPASQKIELTRTEAINRLLRDAYAEWNRSLGQTRLALTVRNSSSTSGDIRVLNNCHIGLGDNTSEFYLRLDSNIKRRVGVVTVGGSSVYNFSFCVNHMYTDTAPKVSCS
ncbi:hypothetical protein BOX15_Mlig015638g1 [Macrostomum lignano]|uniref:Receptor ligand binding region domain-containing protein n=2 Tax=Macrostomum lignano TaxID=282301 RepID=A0A267DE92_9PLAT|nr:hypothetical protein BOX15_Mlig015638g1 [Macrostomum lignano]